MSALPLVRRGTTLAIKANYPLALVAWCPECDATPSAPCVSVSGKERSYPHADRVIRADRIQRGTLVSARRPGEPVGPPLDCEQLGMPLPAPPVHGGERLTSDDC